MASQFVPTQQTQQQQGQGQGQGQVPLTPAQAAPSQAPQTPAKPLGQLGLPINQGFFKPTSMRSITVKQLHDATAAQQPQGSEDRPLLDGEPLFNFALVGKLERKEAGDAMWEVEVDDGTGRISLVHLMEDWELVAEQAPLSGVHEGQYVCVHGWMWPNQGVWNVTAYAVQPVEDQNQVTHHFLRAIFEHRHLLHKQAQAYGGGPGPYPGPPLHLQTPGQAAPSQRQGQWMPIQGGPSQAGPSQRYGAPSQHLQTPSQAVPRQR